MKIQHALGLLAFVAGAGVAPAAFATIVVPQTVEQMAQASAAVVRAKVVAQQAAWDDDHRRIHTYTEVQVLEAIAGPREAGSTLVVRTMGGEVGDIGMRVSGVARFTVGEEVMLFLQADPVDAERFMVIGMSQGKYAIDRSGPAPVAVPTAEGLAYARRDASGTLRVDGHATVADRLPLADLVARVKAALREAPKAPTAPKSPKTPATPSVPEPPSVQPGSTD